MHADAQPAPHPHKTAVWSHAKRWLGWAFLLLVCALLLRLAREVDWDRAVLSLRELPAATLWAAAGLALLSHIFYACYDLIGRHQTQHGLTVQRTASVSFMSYAFNLNLGSLVGGIAFRYRLYSRLGLSTKTITRVLALSLLTNWLGYFAVAGVTLLAWPPELPPGWELAGGLLPLLGAGLLLVVMAYLAACLAARRLQWQWHWRGQTIKLPPVRIAMLQLVLASTSWCVIAAICWVLLQQRVEYTLVLGALLTAAVAGVITHVPAGLGVLEAVFVLLLAQHIGQDEVLGAMLAYRALYYLMPLLVATSMFVLIDLKPGMRTRDRSRT
jgi:glycosyltransferase 2 family protein